MVVFSQNRGNVRKSVDGKSGLEVLMLLIERGLNPALDESQRILSGPLIADLIQKVTVPYIPRTRQFLFRGLEGLYVCMLTDRLRVRFRDIYRNCWK